MWGSARRLSFNVVGRGLLYGGRFQKFLPPSPEQAPAGPHMPGDPRYSSRRPGGQAGLCRGPTGPVIAYSGLKAWRQKLLKATSVRSGTLSGRQELPSLLLTGVILGGHLREGHFLPYQNFHMFSTITLHLPHSFIWQPYQKLLLNQGNFRDIQHINF
jgi:hypothetical protein